MNIEGIGVPTGLRRCEECGYTEPRGLEDAQGYPAEGVCPECGVLLRMLFCDRKVYETCVIVYDEN